MARKKGGGRRRGGGFRGATKRLNKNELMAGGLIGAFGPEAARIHPTGPAIAEIAAGAAFGSDAAQYIGARQLGAYFRDGTSVGGNGGALLG